MKLRDALGLDHINDLPLSFDIGWYEQKAVAVLLALLSLNIKGIRLGPTLPGFVSPNVQAAEHFPGIVLDINKRILRFSIDKFAEELEMALERFEDPNYFDISEAYSSVYHQFLALDLKDRAAIRGQFLFSAMSGYSDLKARDDLDHFFSLVNRPRGIHLCGNPDWEFLLNLDLDVLSLDVFTNAEIFASYAAHIDKFLNRGGVIVWGIVLTAYETFAQEEVPSLIERLEDVWEILWSKGIDPKQIINQGMLSPATCCLVNPDKELTVEKAFSAVNLMAEALRDKHL